MSKKVLFCLLSLALAYSFIPGDVLSQDYPTREIELISGFGPGSSNDSTARLAARFGEKYVGKPIVVVNKAGGGGTRGYSFVGWSQTGWIHPWESIYGRYLHPLSCERGDLPLQKKLQSGVPNLLHAHRPLRQEGKSF